MRQLSKTATPHQYTHASGWQQGHLVSADDPISISIDAFKSEPDEVSKGVDRAVEWSLGFVSQTATVLSLMVTWIMHSLVAHPL